MFIDVFLHQLDITFLLVGSAHVPGAFVNPSKKMFIIGIKAMPLGAARSKYPHIHRCREHLDRGKYPSIRWAFQLTSSQSMKLQIDYFLGSNSLACEFGDGLHDTKEPLIPW
jgi:hypothetical protein